MYTVCSKRPRDRQARKPEGRSGMEMKEIRSIARKRGIAPGRMGKEEIIRAIQRAEGNFDCYGTATEEVCDQEGCLWREDCFFDSTKEEIREPYMQG
jgi:hypothetical protein